MGRSRVARPMVRYRDLQSLSVKWGTVLLIAAIAASVIGVLRPSPGPTALYMLWSRGPTATRLGRVCAATWRVHWRHDDAARPCLSRGVDGLIRVNKCQRDDQTTDRF